MTYTRAIGVACNQGHSLLIVRGLALSRIHPNVLTFLGLLINIGAAVLLAAGQFRMGRRRSSSARACSIWWTAAWRAKPIA